MASYEKLAYTTGTNIRIRSGPGTSYGTVTTVSAKNSVMWTTGYSAGTANGYTWYAVSHYDESEKVWHTGYMPSSYLDVIDETVVFSSGSYSGGSSLSLSWSSVYEDENVDHVSVAYTLTDSNGNTLYTGSGNSCSVDLPSQYANGSSVTFTLRASYAHSKDGNDAYFHVPSVTRTVSITAAWDVLIWKTPNVTASRSGGTINVTWAAAEKGVGVSSIYYFILYGTSESAAGMYTGSSVSSTSYSFDYDKFGVTYYISVVARAYNSSGNLLAQLRSSDITGSFATVSTPAATLTAPGKPVITQTGSTAKIYFAASTASNIGNFSVAYTLKGSSASGKTYDFDTSSAPTSANPVSVSIADHLSYNDQWTFYVYAYVGNADGHDELSQNSASTAATFYLPSVTTPTISTLTHLNGAFSISWSASSGSYGESTDSVSYTLKYWDSENTSDVKTKSMGSSRSASIARWITPTWNSITYSFQVTASYGSASATSSKTIVLEAPRITWDNPSLVVKQVNNQVVASWNPATIVNNYQSQSIEYTLTCGSAYDSLYSGSGTSVTTLPPAYNTNITFQVTAVASQVSGGKYSNSVVLYVYGTSVTAPEDVSVSQVGDMYQITWSPSTGSYGASGSSVSYRVLFDDAAVYDAGSQTQYSFDIPSEFYGVKAGFAIQAFYASASATSEWVYCTAKKEAGGTIYCYIDDAYKPCLVYVYDGSAYKNCEVYVSDGDKWLSGSS